MAEPLHLKDAIHQWFQGAGEEMNIHSDELVNLHCAIQSGRALEADLEAARRICTEELLRFALLLDRLDERQGKTLRHNQHTLAQKVQTLLGLRYP